jgi:hypothetical protein
VGTQGYQIRFNRSAADSQAYVLKLGDKDPNEVPDDAAFHWLWRGLEESLFSGLSGKRTSPECVLELLTWSGIHGMIREDGTVSHSTSCLHQMDGQMPC